MFYGFISAVAFATILAVVAGLTLSGASAVSHDLYATVFKNGKADSASELRSRATTLHWAHRRAAGHCVREAEHRLHGVAGLRDRRLGQLPVLLLSVLWKGCTTKGAVIGGFLGLISSVGLTIVSPSVWEATLGNPPGSAWFPYTSPALFSMTIGFVGVWLFSVLDKSARQPRSAPLSPRSKCVRKPVWVHRAHPATEPLQRGTAAGTRKSRVPSRLFPAQPAGMRLAGAVRSAAHARLTALPATGAA
jgi:cation/acetate symporter